MFANFDPINNDLQFPKFLIAGVEWSGYVWKSTGRLEEISHQRSDGINLVLKIVDERKIFIRIWKEIAAGAVAEMSDTFDDIPTAALAGLEAEFKTVESAGAMWFQCRERDGFAEWVCAFGENDAGKVTRFIVGDGQAQFHAERKIEINGRTFKIEHYGHQLHQHGDTHIKTFDDAAHACASLFDLLLVARGTNDLLSAFKAGREDLKREILKL